MKILFVGTPDFAVVSLKKLFENEKNEIVGVITAPDKPKGRGMELAQSDVKKFALENNLKIFQPERVRKNPELIEEIKELNADIAVVVVYGKLLPKEFLDLFPNGCVNVHPSLLPKYRGAAPIQWAIINGDEKTGVCTMYLDIGMDSGDVIKKEEVEIFEDETAGELWDRLAVLGAELLSETINEISNGIINRKPQEGEVVIAPKIEKEMSKINWGEMTAVQIYNLMRGLTPGLGVYSTLKGKKIKFWKSKVLENNSNFENGEVGTVLVSNEKEGLYIKTKEGILSILEIQGENAKKMPIADFLRGNKIEIGSKFE